MKVKKICFLADSHSLYDDRIYWKEALSLKKAGYEIHFILAGDKPQEGVTNEGVHFQILKKDFFPKYRYLNFLAKRYLPNGLYNQMFIRARRLAADIYHIQDLKVNRIGKKLKNLYHLPKVIYDIHEPYPENIIDYRQTRGLGTIVKKLYAAHIKSWEHQCARIYDLIIVTEENVYKRFTAFLPKEKVQIIYNYTNLDNPVKKGDIEKKEFDAIYTGGITLVRGAFKILEAISILKKKRDNVRILFLGSYFPNDLKDQMHWYIKENKLESNILLLDAVPYNKVAAFYQKSKIGLGIFLPIKTHKIILQIKLFEYMNFGLPIVGSNFGHIRNIIEKDQVGIAINPEDPNEIADAMDSILSNEELYKTLSENGRTAVEKKYRWEFMEEKLILIYSEMLKEQNTKQLLDKFKGK